MNLGTAQVIRGDARHLPLADDSVDLVVTSPPYFALRSYQDGGEHYEGQIGSEPTPAEFVAALLEVTRECVRVLKPSGSLWVNLGDKYNAYNGGRGPGTIQDNGPRQDVPRGNGLDVKSVRPKSLIGIPWRYALACIDDLGLILRAEVIWSKPNGLPESVTDRVRRSHETWFHFTLSPRYFSAVDEIREEFTGSERASGLGWLGRTTGNVLGRETDAHGGLRDQDRNPLGKLPGSVWGARLEAGDSLIRSVLAATAAGALTIEEGEHILWTGSTAYGRRSTTATPTTAGAGSAPTTATATDDTGRPTKETGEPTDSSTRCQSAPSPAASPSTTCAGIAGASTPHTSSPSPSGRTADVDPGQSVAQQDTPTTNRTHTSDATASESADDAWLTEHESDEGASSMAASWSNTTTTGTRTGEASRGSESSIPSVWQIATEPLRVPDHLGIDHFAAFPTEWPKRIIRGWSPAGVCVECGEGRRPVRESEKVTSRPGYNVQDQRMPGRHASGNQGREGRAGDFLVSIAGYTCACCTCSTVPHAVGCRLSLLPSQIPTRPAVVLDPFGGTGTTAMVAKALGRHGISVDMSADYCRLAEWRTNDRNQLAKVLGIDKAPEADTHQLDLFGEATA